MKIRLKLDLVFDNHEAWDNVDDFSTSFVNFLGSQHLLAEKIMSGKEKENCFSLYVYKNPM
jgi:hypothetical protein